MINECIDKTIGLKLHAYELGFLPEVETDEFELHILSCDHCLQQIHNHAPETALLRDDTSVQGTIQKLVSGNKKSQPLESPHSIFGLKLDKKLKVIVSTLLIVIVGFIGFDMVYQADSSAQTIKLYPTRSNTHAVSQLSSQKPIELLFVYESSKRGNLYRIIIHDAQHKIVYENDSFDGFTETQVGKLEFPAGELKENRYTITISDVNGDEVMDTQEYRFTISYK